MSRTDPLTTLAAALCRLWARTYTLGLPLPTRTQRIAELDADLWEQAYARAEAAPLARWSNAAHMVLRTALGIPADLSWSSEAALRAPNARMGAKAQWTRNLLLVVAPLYTVFAALSALGWLPGDLAHFQSTVLISTAVALTSVLGGAWLIPRSPSIGIVVGVPGLLWMVDIAQFAFHLAFGGWYAQLV